MENITYRLKEPQEGVTPANQKETLVYLFFSYGYAEITATGKKKYIPLKYSTGMRIYPHLWNKKAHRAKRTTSFDYHSFNIKLENLTDLIKQLHRENPTIAPDKLKDLLNEQLKNGGSVEMNLNTYIDKYLHDVEKGIRLTYKGEKFKHSTVKTLKGFITKFKQFQDHINRQYDFNDITIDFYNDYTNYLTSLNYSINTIGKHIKQIKTIMRLSRDEGLHENIEIDKRMFKAISKKVENIFLNEDELRQMYNLDLSHKKNYELARDVFLIGAFTAQRYSDYSRIRKEMIKGNNIELIQQKTGEKVIIPMRNEVKEILKKYDYTLPKTYEQKVNKYIKEVGKLAGITELVQTEKTKGGLIVKQDVPKYELIKTHTARRSGATNMYLAGIPSIDIMAITGHKTESEFLKYIKVTKKQIAQNLALHPYFNNPIMKVQ